MGGPKNRYKENGFNLDLTYITDRIIAMAFPASGFEKLYRNSIDEVCEFLTKNHNDKYIVINLSGREIDEKKLKNVKSFDWEDHRSPNFELLFTICNEVASFLKEDS